jgi:hypothetical protein
MNQHDLNRAVAAATGETVSEISHRGFVPLTPTPVERDPLVVDWDEPDERRPAVFPHHPRFDRAVA